MKRKTTFQRDGLTLVGNLFTPENFDEGCEYQAVIVQGSFTSVKEQMPETYAAKFAEQGFIALAFDYAHYGESAGEPRQVESPSEKRRDLEAATTYLSDLPYVQAVGLLGVCTSAGNALDAAAADQRLGALATVAGMLPDPALYTGLFGDDVVAQRKAQAESSRRKYEETGEVDLIPAYSETDPTAVNYIPIEGVFDYYLNESRANIPQYRNESAVMSLGLTLDFDTVNRASAVTTPTMVVHSDESTFPEQAKKVYENLAGKKELVWADGNHYDYYDSPQQIDNAVAHVSRFFRDHLTA